MPLPWNLHSAIDALNQYLFQEVGLQGDQETYDDPANAAIPRVIARKRGMPITLSILWMDVARRLGFNAVGRGPAGPLHHRAEAGPGHPALRPLQRRPRPGRGRARPGWWSRPPAAGPPSTPAMLLPVSNRAILVRLVRNLHLRFLRCARLGRGALDLHPPGAAVPRTRACRTATAPSSTSSAGRWPPGMKDLNEAIRLGQEIDPELVLVDGKTAAGLRSIGIS
jgi:hypothetical protein